MQNLIRIFIATLCLIVLLPQAQAATKGKPKAAQQVQKERLVLMPLRVGDELQSMQAAMESALVDGLQQKYTVLWGEEVEKKAKEVFRKENQKHDCNEERCMQGIVEAFQSELLATANITKQEGGYVVILTIQNLFDHVVVFTRPLQCKGCDSFQVVDKLKELGVAAAPVAATQVVSAAETPQPKVNLNDPDGVLWAEAQKGNSVEDYQVYIDTYPKGKYLPFAKARIKKLNDAAQAAAEQQEQSAWDAAQQGGSEDSYALYLKGYPTGRFAGLAKVRMDKLKNDIAAREEAVQWKTVQSSEDSKTIQNFLNQYPRSAHLAAAQEKLAALKKAEAEMKPGKVFSDCADCPELVIVPAGSFTMGSNTRDVESPAHTVTIKQPFAIGKTEITQGQWKAIMGSNPSSFQNCGDNCPVEKVNWDEAKEFIQKLNAKTGKQYRLPSEAEWEYACRAGQQTEYCGGDNFDSVAWYGAYTNPVGNSAKTTNPVATKQANAWGIYDMSGNVWEWTEDSYHNNYNRAPTGGSAWQGDGAKRVLRGGSWDGDPDITRSAGRGTVDPASRSSNVGFRVARTLP